MTEPVFHYLLLAAQASTAVILALVFLAYHRLYQRPYLACWSISFLLLALYTLFSSASGLAMGHYSASHPLRLSLTAASLAATYLQVLFLLLGVWVLMLERRLASRALRLMVVSLLALAAVVTLLYAFDPEAATQRHVLRVQLRYVLTGLAFLLAGLWLWSQSADRSRMGLRLVGAGFLAYGLHAISLVLLANSAVTLGWGIVVLQARGLIELVLFFAIGMGLVMWLLEVERARAKAAMQRAEYLDQHDPVTSLPNHHALIRFLEQTTEAAGRRGLVLYLVGIDGFRALNESAGLRGGDLFLRECADRLRSMSQPGLMTSRIAGDIFAVVMPSELNSRDLKHQAKRLCGVLSFRPAIAGFDLPMTASAGYAVWPADGADPQTLIVRAQAALAAAKDNGRSSVAAWQRGMQSSRDLRLSREQSMRQLLASDQLCLFYQPIVDLEADRVVSVEALVRWQHPEDGLLPPAEFLPQMHEAGLMAELDNRVLAMALRQLVDWIKQGVAVVPVSVNLSAEQFQSTALVEEITARLANHRLDPGLLQLEVTENIAMVDIQAGTLTLKRLREAGIRVSIDDFGTGYSSLAYLVELPVDKIKIDRRFVQSLDSGPAATRIINAIVSMVHHIGARVVGEGVETAQQKELLRASGCEEGQGYLFSRPMPADRLQTLLQAQQREGLG